MSDYLRLYGTDANADERRAPAVARSPRERELDAIRSEIWADRERLAREGIVVWITGDAPDGADCIEVGVQPLTEQAVAYFHERYGASVQVVESGPPQPA